MKHWIVLVPVAVVAFALSACGGGEPVTYGISGEEIEMLDPDLLPGQILGLDVAQEDVSETIALVENTYIDALSVYSLRREELLQATLQVSRFSDEAAYESESFRQSLVLQIGGTAPKEVRVGEHTVYLTTGTNQGMSIWFDGSDFFVLAVREDFERPRTLLRQVLEVQL
jgi:hypothetical protein